MKPFVIYFPQFYPTPTNDAAWGQGFTDWALVAQANLRGTWERRAPRRGYYDGSDRALHLAHFDEMRRHGVGGFALYHYWFYSHQELDAVESTLLDRPYETTLPWFLVWASEGWSRRWLGDARSIIELSADPDVADIERHCEYLARCFAHPAYLRWNGRPLFVWYHVAHFRRPAEVVERYRAALARLGWDIACAHFVKNPFDAQYAGLVDASYLFEPRLFFGMQRVGRGSAAKRVFERVRSLIGDRAASRLMLVLDRAQQNGSTYAAENFTAYMQSPRRRAFAASLPGVVQDVVSPGWNNSPRYGERFTSLQNLPADSFQALLQGTGRGGLPTLVNAWNEWSEGAAVEPCAYLGTRYLDVLSAPSPVMGEATWRPAGEA
jgi:hypothetical protein